MTVTKMFSFEMGHRLSNYEGKCRRFHGHSYRLEIAVGGEQDTNGIVIDFNYLKAMFERLIDNKFDHKMMLKIGDPINEELRDLKINESIVWVSFNPTAENIVKHLFTILEKHIVQYDPVLKLHVTHVRLYETRTSYTDIYA